MSRRRTGLGLISSIAALSLTSCASCLGSTLPDFDGDFGGQLNDRDDTGAPCLREGGLAMWERTRGSGAAEVIFACKTAGAAAPSVIPEDASLVAEIALGPGWVHRATAACVDWVRREQDSGGRELELLTLVGPHGSLPGPAYRDPAVPSQFFYSDRSLCSATPWSGPPTRRVLPSVAAHGWRPPDLRHGLAAAEFPSVGLIDGLDGVWLLPPAVPDEALRADFCVVEAHGAAGDQTSYWSCGDEGCDAILGLTHLRAMGAAHAGIFSGACWGGRTLGGRSADTTRRLGGSTARNHLLLASLDAGASYAIGSTTIAWGAKDQLLGGPLLADLFVRELETGVEPAVALSAAQATYAAQRDLDPAPGTPDLLPWDAVTATSYVLYQGVPQEWRR